MKNETAYIRHGDYLLPAIRLMPLPAGRRNKPQCELRSLCRYARLHKAYLKEHRPILYSKLLLTEKLYPLLWELDEAAKVRMDAIGNADIANETILSELVYN